MAPISAAATRVADLVSGYREGEIIPISVERVIEWTNDVDSICGWLSTPTKVLLVEALEDALRAGYWSRERIASSLRELDTSEAWIDAPPLTSAQWKWLNVQESAASQPAMLDLVESAIVGAAGDGRHFVYLDDGLFTGGSVLKEIGTWILNSAPRRARLLIAHLVRNVDRYQSTRGVLVALARGRDVDVRMTAAVHFAAPDHHDPMGPTHKPTIGLRLKPTREMYDTSAVCGRFERKFGHLIRPSACIREDAAVRCEGVFRSADHRRVLTRAMLEVGCTLWIETEPNPLLRPLGHDDELSLGVGAMMATFHNSPNSAPLALWWGNREMPSRNPLSKWNPLLPRRPAPSGPR